VSQPMPEGGAPQGGAPPASGGKLGVWGKKIGPIPVWGWSGILLGAILIFMYIKNKNSASATTSTAADADASGDSAAAGTGAGQIPEFVNQTYTTVTPPTEPTVGPTGPAGPTGPPGVAPPQKPDLITANGKQSLAQLAKSRNTTVAHLVSTSEHAAGPGYLTAEQLAAFVKYVKGGTNKPMPKGLSILVSNGPAKGTTS
jgi:hypothetical protein